MHQQLHANQLCNSILQFLVSVGKLYNDIINVQYLRVMVITLDHVTSRVIKIYYDTASMLKTHDGPYDVKTMKAKIQLKFQCDADLGGNPDNGHL